MTEIYRAEHITKTFGHGKTRSPAVKDVSFSLNKGRSPRSSARAAPASRRSPGWRSA